MNHLTRILPCVALTLVAVADLSATTARRLSNQQLAQDADVIAIGRCLETRSVWEGRTLLTLATVAVAETLKGGPEATLTVALPGGIDANRKVPVAMTYAGAPTMRPGEEVFLFLNRDEVVTAGLIVAGFAQGKFSIVQDAAGNRAVSRDLTTLKLQMGPGVVAGTQTVTPLEEFRREVLEYLK
jgi:hypothetical protein